MSRFAMGRGTRTLLVGLFVASIYMITYSARIETGDTRLFFDAVSSMVDHGDTLIDLMAWFRFPVSGFDLANPLPLQDVNTEPMHLLLGALLYITAKGVPGIGLVHTVWLFNIFVGAAAVCVLYRYAQLLGYHERTALIAAILFAVATLLFPYTRTFFREPLALLLLLSGAFTLEKLRRLDYRAAIWATVAAAAMIGMILTKASMLLALPAVVLIGLPTIKLTRRHIVTLAVISILILLLVLLLSASGIAGDRYNIVRRLSAIYDDYIGAALQGYLLSPGGSVWGTSPIILLAIPGTWLLTRTRQWRYPLVFIVLTLVMAFGYAYLTHAQWFGGLSLPPRFLLPVLPFWMLAALPVIERLNQRRITLAGVVIIGLIAYSLWVQISGVTLTLSDYPNALPPESNQLIEWSGGLNDPRWFRWVVIPQLWGHLPLDLAWRAVDLPAWGITFAVLAGVSFVVLFTPRFSHRIIVWSLALVWVVSVFLGLRALYVMDDRYLARDDSLFAAMDILERETDSSDIVLLSSPRYEPFFQNFGNWQDSARMIALPQQPGERPSLEQTAVIESDNPEALLMNYTIPLLQNLAATHDRLWLLVDGSPELGWSTRPVERYLSAFYYPIRAIQVGDFTRLIEYSTVAAPRAYGFRDAQRSVDLSFGDLRLLGFELPRGDTIRAEGALPISLFWETSTQISSRYTIAVYLRDENGAPISQNDSPPRGGFAPTDSWMPGLPVWDHRALALPDDIAAGVYQLWVKVYDFAPDGSVNDLPVIGLQALDGVIGVLPITITLTAAE